ncbi:MAG: hypothetical protein Q7I92_05355, partial [Humidesulfovibrio sp.]|nr:hypothetical protein [Humidesulfovibrio sp.]
MILTTSALLKKCMKNSWFKPRRYRHFDWPVGTPDSIREKICSPKHVAEWSFFPFLKFEIATRKFSKVGGEKRKTRVIMYASHADACLYSYYASKISKKYEELIRNLNVDNHILAYRRISGKC